jgi:alcohol dehydrogenase class IV
MSSRIIQLESKSDITGSLDLDNITNIYYGPGSRLLLQKSLGAYKNILIVSSANGRKRILKERSIVAALEEKNLNWVDSINSYPTLEQMSVILENESNSKVDVILGIGGGSVLDVAKIISALLPMKSEYTLEQVCENPEVLDRSLKIPTLLMPTTCGTGSEVTPFATLWDESTKSKLSLAHKILLPSVIIGDPDLLAGLKANVVYSTALDALIQNFESLWNVNANEKSRALAIEGLDYSIEGLQVYGIDGLNQRSADLLLRASLFSGASIAITRTAICHAISYPLTARFGVPHGYACAFSLVPVLNHMLERSHSFRSLVDRSVNFSSEKEFVEVIRKIYRDSAAGTLLREYLPSLEEILNLNHEMLGSIRSRNTIIPIESEQLENLIKESYSVMLE